MKPHRTHTTEDQNRKKIADLEEHLAFVRSLKAQTKRLAVEQSDRIGSADQMLIQQQRQIVALEDELKKLRRLVDGEQSKRRRS